MLNFSPKSLKFLHSLCSFLLLVAVIPMVVLSSMVFAQEGDSSKRIFFQNLESLDPVASCTLLLWSKDLERFKSAALRVVGEGKHEQSSLSTGSTVDDARPAKKAGEEFTHAVTVAIQLDAKEVAAFDYFAILLFDTNAKEPFATIGPIPFSGELLESMTKEAESDRIRAAIARNRQASTTLSQNLSSERTRLQSIERDHGVVFGQSTIDALGRSLNEKKLELRRVQQDYTQLKAIVAFSQATESDRERRSERETEYRTLEYRTLIRANREKIASTYSAQSSAPTSNVGNEPLLPTEDLLAKLALIEQTQGEDLESLQVELAILKNRSQTVQSGATPASPTTQGGGYGGEIRTPQADVAPNSDRALQEYLE